MSFMTSPDSYIPTLEELKSALQILLKEHFELLKEIRDELKKLNESIHKPDE